MTTPRLVVRGRAELRRRPFVVADVAVAERLPVAEELCSDGPHLATGQIQIGDPTLTNETSMHLDLGLRGKHGDLTWSLTAFATSYDDFIFLEDTAVIDPIDNLPIFAFVQQDADFDGLEAEIFTPIAEVAAGEVDMRLFADYVKGEADSSGDLPRMPPARYGARFQYHDERVLVGLETTWYDDQDDIAEFETPTEGYTMVNADFRWRVGNDARRGPRAVRERNELDGRGGAQAHVVRQGRRAAARTQLRGRRAQPLLRAWAAVGRKLLLHLRHSRRPWRSARN